MVKSFMSLAARGLAVGAVLAGLAFAAGNPASAGEALDKIKARGLIKVGVGTSPGFFAPDSSGQWQGFFVDFGRALAITVFNDPKKVEFTSFLAAAAPPGAPGGRVRHPSVRRHGDDHPRLQARLLLRAGAVL
jgi:ABC-type amino acid transport substrate-binding protein